ncbi:MAG: NEW3 domain-containing protein [Thermoplasmatota archaeon]
MHPLRGCLLAVLVVTAAVPLAGGAPNAARSPDLATPARILTVTTADNGETLVTTVDPGSTATSNATVPTWFLWDGNGRLLERGDADHPTCASRPPDLCTAPAVGGAITRDGRRFAVVSDVTPAALPTDTARGILLVGTLAGEAGRIPLEFAPTAVAMDASGTTIAVAGVATPLPPAKPFGEVRLFSWYGGSTPVPFANATFVSAVHALAVSADGQEVAVGASTFVRVHRDGHQDSLDLGSNVTAVAIADSSPHLAVAGTLSGDVWMATDGSLTATSTHLLSTVEGIAATGDGGEVVAALQSGRLIRFTLAGNDSASTSLDLGVPVTGMALASDGLTAVVATGLGIVQVDATRLVPLWNDTFLPVGLGLTADGEQVVAGAGHVVRVWQALHDVTADAPAVTLLGRHVSLNVTLRNRGNRLQDSPVTVEWPPGWSGTLSPANYSLEPGEAAVLQLYANAPAKISPGNVTLPLLFAGGFVNATVVVPRIESFRAQVKGPQSLAISPGQTTVFGVTITNTGNDEQRFAVPLVVTPSSWSAQATPGDLDLKPGQSADVDLIVLAPQGAVVGNAGNVSVRLPGAAAWVIATVGAKFSPGLTFVARATVSPGNLTAVSITLQNQGNAQDSIVAAVDPDTLPAGWLALWPGGAASQEVRDIPAGSGVPVTLQIEAPVGAGPGVLRLHVTARSEGDSTQSADGYLSLTIAGTPAGTTSAKGTSFVGVGLVAVALMLAARRR